jgi:hypothetical protein
MKSFLIFLFIGPSAVFSQIRIPHFPVDSATGKIQYRQVFDLPGDNKKKIFDVMSKWLVDDGRSKNHGTVLDDKDDKSILAAVACFITPSQGQLSALSIDGTEYVLGLEVKDEHLSITLSGFEVKTDDGLIPLEQYRDQVVRIGSRQSSALSPQLPGSGNSVKAFVEKFNDSQSDIFADIDIAAHDLLRDAQKFVKKALKQQLL